MPAARVGMRGNGADASVRFLLYRKGRSPRTGKQHGGKENRKTAHERDRGGYQELSQATEPRVDREVLSLVQRSCGPEADFRRKMAFIGVKSRQLVKYLICEAL